MQLREGAMTIHREDLIENLEKIRSRLCCYVNSKSFCDCKYGASFEGEDSGCPEIRLVIEMLRLMSDEQYGAFIREHEGYWCRLPLELSEEKLQVLNDVLKQKLDILGSETRNTLKFLLEELYRRGFGDAFYHVRSKDVWLEVMPTIRKIVTSAVYAVLGVKEEK